MQLHLFVSSSDGALYDTRQPSWSSAPPLRAIYRYSFSQIDTPAQFKATLRNGAHAWPSGYPLYFICDDGAAICFGCARKEARNVIEALQTPHDHSGWRVTATDINWEDSELTCDHCSQRIESAYGED